MRRPKTFIICCVILLAIVASGIIIPQVKREKAQKELKEKHEAELEILAAYPWIDEIDPDNIAKLTTCEGDIVYTVTDKEAIAEIMGIIRDTNPQPVIINPEDDKGRPAGGPKNALWLDITTKDDKESWSLTIDDENFPTDFVIDHTIYKNKDTGWFETTTGYFTKPDKIYGKIKSIMYNGTRIDLNEQVDTEDEQPKAVSFEYNPAAVYTAEELDYVAKEGYFTMDICVCGGKIFFSYMKNDIPESHGDYNYESFLKQEYIWGYMDLKGENRHEFRITPKDPEYPYAGVSCIIGATDDRVYAMTFRAKDDEYFGKDLDRYIVEDYITSFDMSGNVLAKTLYEYDYSYPYEHTLGDKSFVTKEGTVALFNGALALYDADLNEVALNTDKRISGIYPSSDGNIIALFTDEKEKKIAVYSAKDLKVLKEETIPFNYAGKQVKGIIDGRDALVNIWEQSGGEKIIEVDLTTGDETEEMDLFHSGINGYYIKSIAEINENGILAECEDAYSPHGSSLTRYVRMDESIARNRKRIVVCDYAASLYSFNGSNKDYYADQYKDENRSFLSVPGELTETFKGEDCPDVATVRNFTDDFFDTGVLADVSELLKENELPDGIKDTFSEDGVLRAYPKHYTIVSLVTYKDIAKDGELNLDTFFDCIKKSEGKKLFANAWQDVFDFFLEYPGNPFLNRDEGTCNFEGDEFKSFLKMIKNLDDRDDSEDVMFYKPRGSEIISWDEILNQWLKHQKEAGSIFMISIFNGMYYDEWIDDLFGENMVYAGLPLKDGSKSFVYSADAWVINELSDEKEGALEFIKHCNDVQNSRTVTKADYEALAGELHANAFEEAIAGEIMAAVNDVGGFIHGDSEEYDFMSTTFDKYFNDEISESETAEAFQEYFSSKMR